MMTSNNAITPQISVEEVEIEFPWGKLAAKWWGSKQQKPILVLHGWQDNAGNGFSLISVPAL